jgi:transposase
MIRLTLTTEQTQELDRRLRQHNSSPIPALRLEMVRLASHDWRIPRIAHHLGCHEQTVRKFIKAFIAEGFAGLKDRPRPGRTPPLTEAHLIALENLIDTTERTWTTPQLAGWLEQERHVRVHPDHLSRMLHRRHFAWKRTKRSVAHKRKNPDLYDAKVAELEGFKNRPSKA